MHRGQLVLEFIGLLDRVGFMTLGNFPTLEIDLFGLSPRFVSHAIINRASLPPGELPHPHGKCNQRCPAFAFHFSCLPLPNCFLAADPISVTKL